MGRKRSRLWIALALAAVLCAAVLANRVLSRVATQIVNQRLPQLLGTEATVGKISLGLVQGSVALADLKIENPTGFPRAEALFVPRMRFDLDLFSLRGKPWIVEEIRIEEAQVRLQRNRARRVNLEELFGHVLSGQGREKEAHGKHDGGVQPPGIPNASGKSRGSGQEMGSVETRPEEDDGPIEIQVKRLWITDLHFVYTDASLKLEKELKDVDVVAESLAYAPARVGEPLLPGRIVLTGRVVQEPFPAAWLGLYARVGFLAHGIPPLNASFQLADLELAPLGSIVPASASKVLGGEALNLSAEGAVAQDLLRVLLRLESCGGNVFSLKIEGTPRRPVYDTKSLVFKILQNAAGNLVGRVSDPRLLTDTAAKTGSTLGRGVVGMLETAAAGLLKTTKGIGRGDLKTAAEGIGTATAGALGEGADAVGGAAKGVAEGVSRAGSGSNASAQEWRKQAQQRWEGAWREARERVDRMPYPRP